MSTRTLIDQLQADGFSEALSNAVDLRMRRKRKRVRNALAGSVAASAIALLAFWAVPYFRDTARIATSVADIRSITLDDGTHLEVNAHTKLASDFRFGRRHLDLKTGEIFITVAKDPTKPFIILTSSGTIRVTGTTFNVRSGKKGTQVALVEGSVAIRDQFGREERMTAGYLADLTATGMALRTLSSMEIDHATAWRRGEIVLDGMTLAEAAERFAAFYDKKIDVDPAAASMRLGGTYALDNLPQFFDGLRATQALTVLTGEAGAYRILRRSGVPEKKIEKE